MTQRRRGLIRESFGAGWKGRDGDGSTGGQLTLAADFSLPKAAKAACFCGGGGSETCKQGPEKQPLRDGGRGVAAHHSTPVGEDSDRLGPEVLEEVLLLILAELGRQVADQEGFGAARSDRFLVLVHLFLFCFVSAGGKAKLHRSTPSPFLPTRVVRLVHRMKQTTEFDIMK